MASVFRISPYYPYIVVKLWFCFMILEFVLYSLCVLNVEQPRSTNKLTAVIDNISIYIHGHNIN